MVNTLPHQRPAVGRKFRPDEGSSRHVIRHSVLRTGSRTRCGTHFTGLSAGHPAVTNQPLTRGKDPS